MSPTAFPVLQAVLLILSVAQAASSGTGQAGSPGQRHWRTAGANSLTTASKPLAAVYVRAGLPQEALDRQLVPQAGAATTRALAPDANPVVLAETLRALSGATPRDLLEEIVTRGKVGSAGDRVAAIEANWILGDLDAVVRDWEESLLTGRRGVRTADYLARLSLASNDLLRNHAGSVRRVLDRLEPDADRYSLGLLLLEHRLDPLGSRWRQHLGRSWNDSPERILGLMASLETEAGKPDAALPWLLWQVQTERFGPSGAVARDSDRVALLVRTLAAVGLSDWRPADRGLALALDEASSRRPRSEAAKLWDRTDANGELVVLDEGCPGILNEVLAARGHSLVYRYGARWSTHAPAYTRWSRTCSWPAPVLPHLLRSHMPSDDLLRWRASEWLRRREFLRAARDYDQLISGAEGPRYVREGILAILAAGFTRKRPQALEVMDLVRQWVPSGAQGGAALDALMDLEEAFNSENKQLRLFRRERAAARANDPGTLLDLGRLYLRIKRPDKALPFAVVAVSLTKASDPLRERALRTALFSLQALGWPWEVTVSGHQVIAPALATETKVPTDFPPNGCAILLDRVVTEASTDPRGWLNHPSFRTYSVTCGLHGPLKPEAHARHASIPRE